MGIEKVESRNSKGRRKFLKGIGTAVAVSVVPTQGAFANEPGTDDLLHATGTRIHKFIPDDDTYEHTMRFISENLKERYGSATVSFTEGSVPREYIADEYKNPDRTIVVRYKDTGIFGSMEQHAGAEREIRQKQNQDVGAQSHLPDYGGPLYTYNSSDSTTTDTDERTAPINVAWRNKTAYSAWYEMRNDGGWGTFLPEGERYIVLGDWGSEYTKSQDESVQQSTEYWTGAQYHTRLYDLPDSDGGGNYPCVGQAHHDPWDHDKYQGDDNWRFSESRKAVRDTWLNEIGGYSAETVDVMNGSGYGGDVSSNGNLTKIY